MPSSIPSWQTVRFGARTGRDFVGYHNERRTCDLCRRAAACDQFPNILTLLPPNRPPATESRTRVAVNRDRLAL